MNEELLFAELLTKISEEERDELLLNLRAGKRSEAFELIVKLIRKHRKKLNYLKAA
ncbi:MAG: hypothetical protein K8F36_05615 [Melioribacteraceae bacterium]|nr:hypothetical protein [Melioribacteraceae bacterium]